MRINPHHFIATGQGKNDTDRVEKMNASCHAE